LREGFDPFGTSRLEYDAYRSGTHVFTASGVALQQFVTLAGRDEPERVSGALVSIGFLDAIGVAPLAGRGFPPDHLRPGAGPAADMRPEAAPAALLSYDLWQRRCGGDRAAVGSTFAADGRVYTIVGVMPRGFDLPSGAALWLPDQTNPDTLPLQRRSATTHAM